MLLQGVGLPFYIRWEVVRMKFDFRDLMAFGMFILPLQTFILKIRQQRFLSSGNIYANGCFSVMVVKPYPLQQSVPLQAPKVQVYRQPRDIRQVEPPILHLGYKAEVGHQHFIEGLVVF